MRTYNRVRRSDDEIAAMSARQSEALVLAHERLRTQALVAMLELPGGVVPSIPFPERTLRALKSRDLVEVRYVLTPKGRRLAEEKRHG